MKKNITVLVGSGAIGLACARRVSATRHILLADINVDTAAAKAEELRDLGYSVSETQADVCSRSSVATLTQTAQSLGHVDRVIHAAGVSPSNAPPDVVLRVDLLGTAMVLEGFSAVIADSGCGLVISSHAGHRLPPLSAQDESLLATTAVDDLLSLPLLQNIDDAFYAYQIAKRACALRVQAQSVKWARRGARLNTISPGITMSPLARKEMSGRRADSYKAMIEHCAAGRAGTVDEVAALAAFIMGETGAMMSGSDVLIDGGVTASHFYQTKV